MPNLPSQNQSGFQSGRSINAPAPFVSGVTSDQKDRDIRRRVITRVNRPIMDVPDIPRSLSWVVKLVKYGSDLLSQKISKYLLEDARQVQLYFRRNALLDPPVSSFPFDQIVGIQAGTAVALPIGAGYQTVAQFTIPEGHVGVLRFVGHDLSNVGAWPQVQWRIRVDNITVGSYVGWYGQMGTMLNPFERYYTKIDQNGTVFLEASNIGFGPPLTATARIGGWYFFSPQKAEGVGDTLVD